MSYSEYSKLTVTDGSSAVLSDIPTRPEHSEWMARALTEGAAAGERGEIPIGAVVVDERGVIIGSAGNTREHEHDPSAHAEVNAIRQAAAHRGRWFLVPGRRRPAPQAVVTMCCATGGLPRPPRCMRGCVLMSVSS